MRKTCLGPQPQITHQGLCWWVDWRRLHHVKWSFHTRAAAAAAESSLICARTCTEILYFPENPVGWNGWLSVNERKASIDLKWLNCSAWEILRTRQICVMVNIPAPWALGERQQHTNSSLPPPFRQRRRLQGKHKDGTHFLNDSPKPWEPFRSKPICKWWLLLVLTLRSAEMLLRIQA